MKAIVIGGGVSGLSAAIALQRVGIASEVFERAPEIRDIGAGKSLWHNGLQALGSLGVADPVLAASSPVEELLVLSWRGRLFHRIRVGKLGQSLAVERQAVLAALASSVDPRAIHTGARCIGIEQDGAGVTARFEDGLDAEGDVLVGADGIFSTVRSTIFPSWTPRYADHVAWRGIAHYADDRWPAGISFNWYGRGKHFAVIPLRDGKTFWYGTKNLPHDSSDGGKEQILEVFSDAVDGVLGLIQATEPEWIVRTRLYDLPFRRHWASGRVVLIGDAAHAMRPNLGQGACTALEDSVVLSDSLAGASDVEGGLRSFERRRRRRVRWIHRLSEITSRIQLLEGRTTTTLRDVSLWMQPGPLIAQTFFRPILNFRSGRGSS